MPIQAPFRTPFVSICDFGAVPDDPAPAVRSMNSRAFVAALATMQSEGQAWGHPLFVPSGTFHLAEDLHISKSLTLFGTGIQGESILMLPPGASVVIDPGSDDDLTSSGAECVIRDLQIISDEGWGATDVDVFDATTFDPPTLEGTSKGTPGIVMHSTASIQRVYIKGFSGTGIYIFSPGDTANSNTWRLHDVYVNKCGGHGIHVDGGEAQSGLCTGAKVIVVGGNGIYNSSGGGNTYVGCDVEVIKGRGYMSDSGGQTTFVGCFSEANELTRLIAGGNVWIGGAGAGFTDDTSAFVAEGYGTVRPFEVPNLRTPGIKLYVGYPNDATDPTTISAWENGNNDGSGPEFYVMRWDDGNKLWSVENGSILPDALGALSALDRRNIAYYLTGKGHPRGPWLQGFSEVLLGAADGPIKISRGDEPAAGTGEPGDIVYNTSPSVGDHVGWVCIGASRQWKRFGEIVD